MFDVEYDTSSREIRTYPGNGGYMEMIDLFMKIIEQQGIVALVLLLMMFQNRNERSELLRKNCELSHFIMDLLQRTLPSNTHADHDDGTTRDQP